MLLLFRIGQFDWSKKWKFQLSEGIIQTECNERKSRRMESMDFALIKNKKKG